MLLPAALVALFLCEWVVLLTRSFGGGMGQDFTTLYVAALAWRHGVDPYASALPAHLAATLGVRWQGELELPTLPALAALLTLLPPRGAFLLYALLQQALVLGGVRLLVPAGRRRIAGLVALASAPTFLVCYYGQSSALVAAAVAVGWWARRHNRPALLGLCVGLALCKPQLGACVALPLLWGAPGTRGTRGTRGTQGTPGTWRLLAGLGAGLSVLLALALLVVGPTGLPSYLRIAHDFGASGQATAQATADGLGLTALPRGLLLVTLPLVAASGLLLIRRGRRSPTEGDVAAACALLALLLPYSHQYDSIALLPALGVAWHTRPGRGMALVALLVLSVPLAALLSVPLPFRPLPLALLLWVGLQVSAGILRWPWSLSAFGASRPGTAVAPHRAPYPQLDRTARRGRTGP